MNNSNFIVCDIGKKQITVYDPQEKVHHEITTDDFRSLNIPGLFDGMTVVIEDAHLRAQEDNSLAQTYTIDELEKIHETSIKRNVTILCFPQKVTPKARKIYSISIGNKLIDKTDKNDTVSIAHYLKNLPEVFKTLKKFSPITGSEHEESIKHIYHDRDALTEDSNLGRNEKYGIGKNNHYDDAVSEWIKNNISRLYSELDDDSRDYFKLTLTKKGNALMPGILNYTSETILKQIYNVVNTILTPAGDLRFRSDRANLPIEDKYKVPQWKYAKKVYFGITPYHMKAGVTASNYKYHKRKAGNKNKISMAFDEKGNPKSNTFRSLEDVKRVRDEMNYADKQLRTLWRTVRKMIVEDGIR
tara:strand:- start:410 stop:1483 length:1074 start_codon:yes stop_codon:yes gene_type:complete